MSQGLGSIRRVQGKEAVQYLDILADEDNNIALLTAFIEAFTSACSTLLRTVGVFSLINLAWSAIGIGDGQEEHVPPPKKKLGKIFRQFSCKIPAFWHFSSKYH